MLFFELIQVAIGRRKRLSITPSASEWKHLYQVAGQHTLQALCYQGILRLPAEQQPSEGDMTNWIWMARRAEDRSRQMEQYTVSACRGLEKRGMNACVLKGQGVALYYGDLQRCRYASDVDLWVAPQLDPDHDTRCRIKQFVYRVIGHRTLLRYHHIDFPVFDGVRVELHFLPVFLNNPFANLRLKRWYRKQRSQQMHHLMRMGETEVAVPTPEFNAIYLLLHINKHLFEEGIGLRHLLDYYFVLTHIRTPMQRQHLQRMVRLFNLEPLAGAVMYIMCEVFAMPYSALPLPIHHKHGIALLSEIMQGGNFGEYDTRYVKGDAGNDLRSMLHRYWRKTKRNLTLSYHFTIEGLWEPVTHLYHFVLNSCL